MAERLRILIVGHGRMGRLVEGLAPAYGCEVAGIVTGSSAGAAFDTHGAEVAVDFSLPQAVLPNLRRLAAAGINIVLGTTGWQGHEDDCRDIVAASNIGVIASANFAIGMHVFKRVVADAALRFGRMTDVGAWIHEAHHGGKKDAPSGTALLLHQAMTDAGYSRDINISSTRAGSIPGTHTVGFDGPSESVTLTHTVRDRAVFARGALEAARWVRGRKGWFTVEDML
jgi:4-hydroxy-tetrahydrodipicolinate reductase